VARACARWGLTGIEFLAGIPGTLGGALAMNAGAFGGETWERVIAVETLDRQGIRRIREPRDFQIGYRQVAGPPDEWFIAAHLQLSLGDRFQSLARIKALVERRNSTQPIGLPSAGSVFRNPPADHAARLIEACGLKGARVGRAMVSEKHANFIINLGGATAVDVESLMSRVADTVEYVHGVRLIPEVHIVGELLKGEGEVGQP
jgi:UDP-N-acetylmuramate dehydrogenase